MGERIETSKAIDIEELVKSVDEKKKAALQRKRPIKPKIFRAPENVRSSDPEAYEPKLVSIGPYHRAKSKDDFKAMEELKWRLLDHYLFRANNISTAWFLREMESSEEKARSYYSEVIDIESDEFVEMLLLDGCFLVQIILFFVTPKQSPQELTQLLKGNMWFKNLLFRDLLLLENQLPYFIVKDLLDALGIQEPDAIFTALEPFNCFLPNELKIPASEALSQVQKVHHLLHLFHKWIMFDPKERRKTCCKEPSSGRLCSALSSLTNKTKDQLFKLILCCSGASDPRQEEPLISSPLLNETSREGSSGVNPSSSGADSLKSLWSIPSVIGLRDAGVEVKVIEEDNFLNISFRNGVLSIPAIKVDDNTSFILRNLIAFEQCYPRIRMDVTNYTLFMDNIINTPRDVELLCEVEIIDRQLGSDEEIARLFNKLCEGVVSDVEERNHLDPVFGDVKEYCDSRWHRWRAKLMHDYFSNPWATISVVAATVLLVLTVLQTVFSVLSYLG